MCICELEDSLRVSEHHLLTWSSYSIKFICEHPKIPNSSNSGAEVLTASVHRNVTLPPPPPPPPKHYFNMKQPTLHDKPGSDCVMGWATGTGTMEQVPTWMGPTDMSRLFSWASVVEDDRPSTDTMQGCGLHSTTRRFCLFGIGRPRPIGPAAPRPLLCMTTCQRQKGLVNSKAFVFWHNY